MWTVLVENRSAFFITLPRHRAMGTGFSEDNRVAGGGRNSVNTSGDIFLSFAYPPVVRKPNIRLMAPWDASETPITCLNIIQFKCNRHQPIKKSPVAVAVIALATIGCTD
jgi:hypothetical protein